jgi:ribosomal protein S18 acetylase RimI-like enzyme
MQTDGIPVPDGLSLRPAQSADSNFLEALYSSTRDDLRQINAESGFVEELIKMQHALQMQGNAANYPDALQLVVEKFGEPIGRVIVDFGPNEVKILNIAFINEARGKGYGSGLLRGLQQVAAKLQTPLTLEVMQSNLQARQLYLRLGFTVEQTGPIEERMVWHPGQNF